MRALSIRQPYAELILRGIKTIEFRTMRTRIIGERFYIYAAPSKTKAERNLADDLNSPDSGADLPARVIVGSAKISRCTRDNGIYEWHLSDVRRYKRHRTPRNMPQPVWFNPF